MLELLVWLLSSLAMIVNRTECHENNTEISSVYFKVSRSEHHPRGCLIICMNKPPALAC